MSGVEGINLPEQILFYNLKKPDISAKAYEVSARAKLKDKSYFEKEFDTGEVKRLGLKNFEEIKIYLTTHKSIKLEQFYFDLIDGFSLRTMKDIKRGAVDLRDAVEKKDYEAIEKKYDVSPVLKGIGKTIAAVQITDRRLADEVDLLQMKIDSGGVNLRDFERTYGLIEDIYRNGNEETKEQAKMILAYLNSRIAGMGPAYTEATEGEVVKEIKALREEEKNRQTEIEKQNKIKEEKEKKEAEEKDDRERLEYFELMWNFRGPEAERKSALDADWSKKIEGLKRAKINELNNAVAGKARHAGGDLKQLLSLGEKDVPRGEGVFVADNRELNEMIYRIPGVKENLTEIMNIFFEPGEENGQFVLNMKENEETNKYYSDRGQLLEMLVNKYKKGPSIKDKADVTEAAAIALGLLWVGNTWESAGKGKMTTLSSPSMTFFMFPSSRGFNKINKLETWGGDRLGTWLVHGKRQADSGNGNFLKFMEDWKNDKVHPFPKRLFYSIWEIEEVATEGGEKMSMAQAFYEGKKIDFARSGDGISTNYFINDYFDYAGTMLKLYDLAIGNSLLKVDEAGKWVFDLNRAVLKGREKELVSPYIDQEFVRWGIAASYEGGLIRLKDSTTLLNYTRPIPTLSTFFDILLGGMDPRILDKKEKREIRQAYLADDSIGRGWKIMTGLVN